MMKFNAKLDQWVENEDDRALEKEQYFIRKKIDEEGQPSLLGTVHGVGYKLVEPEA